MTLLLLFACRDPGTSFPGGGTWAPLPQDTARSTEETADTSDSDSDSDSAEDSGETGETDTEPTIPGADNCGTGMNKVACNLVGMTQKGQEWALWDQYEDEVVVVIGHEYDQQLGTISDYLQGAAQGRGATAAVVLLDSINQVPAEEADAARWAEKHGLDTVVWDESGDIRKTWAFSSSTTTYVIDATMTIRWVGYGYVDEDQLDAKLKSL